MSKYFAAFALVLVVSVLAPGSAHAAIVISEVAWMGTSAGATCEWVEFYNDGADSVSLSGWTFTIANVGATTEKVISLEGDIAALGYTVFARDTESCTTPASGAATYTPVSFGSGISNTATQLTLSDGQGYENIVDAKDGWGDIGGDNTTKHTLQRLGSDWVTAAATPEAAYESGGTVDTSTTTPVETGTTTPVVTVGGTAPKTGTPAASPVRTLSLDAGSDRIVLAQVPTPFRAVAYTEKGRVNENANITWNFGDGVRTEGEDVIHAYQAPGEYVVSVRARDKEAETLRTLKVVVEDAGVGITVTNQGIVLTNQGARMADVSHWEITEGKKRFILPEDTALWPGSRVFLAPEVTGLGTSSEVMLQYPGGKEAAKSVVETVVKKEKPVAPKPVLKPTPAPVGIQKVQKVELPAPIATTTDEEGINAPTAPNLSAAVGAAVIPSRKSRSTPWFMCLFGSVLACSAAFVVP